LDKNDSINSDKIEIIISNYPDINLEWLITGEGEMLRTTIAEPAVTPSKTAPPPVNKSQTAQDTPYIIDKLVQRVESLARENAVLEVKVSSLESENKQLQASNASLRKRLMDAELEELEELEEDLIKKNTICDHVPIAASA
jgi:predicted RNase H-like nuclease (RuvC/YqgF family)